MTHRKIIYSLSVFLLMITCAYAVNGTLSGKKGRVKSPGKSVHFVQCNPGERFKVIVHSDQKTDVAIFYRTIVNGRRGGSTQMRSKNKTRHTVNFTAPNSKPKNRMKYWEYEVQVSPGRGVSQTNYTITIR